MRPSVSRGVAARLLDAIGRVAGRPEECARDPARHFRRSRRLPLARLLLLIVSWAQETAGAELADLAGWDGSAPTGGALTQQWKKLRDDVLPRLHAAFLSSFAPVPYRGSYRLYAADGTEMQLLPGTGGDACRVANGKGGGSHWEAHLTCSFDLVRRTFEDMVDQGGAGENEPRALCELVDRAEPGEGLTALWLADRNFCTWNVLSHMARAGASFCVRAGDARAAAILGRDLPDAALDADLERCVVRVRRASARSRPDEPGLYRFLGAGRTFDAIGPGEEGEEWLRLRLVRVALPAGGDGDADGGGEEGGGGEEEGGGGRWLNLVTDLPRGEFPPDELAALYARRWDEEVGFSHLKHTVGMRDPRTRDYGRAVQEMWGRLVLYNACSLGTAGVPDPPPGPVRARATDRTTAFKAFMRMLRASVRRASFDVEAFAARHSHCVRPGRGHPRRRRPASPPKSGYRH